MSKQDALSVVGRMPPKYHKHPGENYDVMKSEVCNFLMNMPEVREYLFSQMKPAMLFDPVTRQWRGKYYLPQRKEMNA